MGDNALERNKVRYGTSLGAALCDLSDAREMLLLNLRGALVHLRKVSQSPDMKEMHFVQMKEFVFSV